MLEDIRDHSPTPTAQECEWMDARPFTALARVAVVALVIGAIASALPALEASTPIVAAVAAK